MTTSLAQTRARSARSSPGASSPKGESAALAMDRALVKATAAAGPPKWGKSASEATSRPTRWPGLTRTSWSKRRALGLCQGPARSSPRLTENGPRSVARTGGRPWPWVLSPGASTRALSHVPG